MTVSSIQPPVYTAHNVADVLNSLPMVLGFTPEESLIAVATHGKRCAFGFRMRVDLPAQQHIGHVARLVAHHVLHNQADGVILVAVSARQDLARATLDAICAMLAPSPVALVVRARTDGSRYWTDQSGEPDGGTAFEFDDNHESRVHAVASGQEILGRREDLVRRFAGPQGQRLRELQALATQIAAEPSPSLAARRALALDFMQRAAGPAGVSDEEALRACCAVSSIAVRDVVWEQINHDNARQMLAALMRAVAVAVEPWHVAVMSLAGFAAWLDGDGAKALIAIERALSIDPAYSMAVGLMELLEVGANPAKWSW
jgi:hypothetical protein